ncbi:MAG: hypothetical protein B6U78_01330 [Candidatus Aenigmarchaeota archaeon ex4484_224]|nr:MAG: hypothetical protein B6U78_01330 [Candidatus Aenigmarchaeota archaeon ex4484_224]
MNMKEERIKQGEKAALVGAFSIILLSILEALIGLFSSALILVSDALHNLTDSLVLFASWLGLRISRRKPTEKFPFGFYKAENLISLLISIFIVYAAFELLIEGYQRIFVLTEFKMPLEVFGITIVSIIFSYFLAVYLIKKGKKVNSQALIVNGKERRAHVLSGIAILLVVFLSFYKVPYVEGLAVIFFSILVFRDGIISAKDSIFSLLDVSPGKEIEKRVKKEILSVKGVKRIKEIKLRRSGPFILGEAKIEVEEKTDVKKAHKIADLVEEIVKEKFDEIISFSIHFEPFERREIIIAIPTNENKKLNSKVSKEFSRANFFVLVKVDRKAKKVKKVVVKKNKFKEKKIRVGLTVGNFLVNQKVDIVICKEIGGIAFNTLRSNFVEIFRIKKDLTIKESIEKFLKGKLEIVEKPTRKSG